jgi:hypothetical protein
MLFGPSRALRMRFYVFFLVVSCKDAGEVGVEGYGRLSVHDGLLEVGLFVGGDILCKMGGGLW